MAKDNPVVEFLAAAETVLRDNVIAASTGDARFAGLMVASAMGMAKRDIELSEHCAATARDVTALVPQPSPFPTDLMALVHLLRVGMMDGDDDVFGRLYRDAVTRTAVTRPTILTHADLLLAGLD